MEVNVPEKFLILKNFALTVYLKPSGPTDYFKIPTWNHIATMKPRTYGLQFTKIASTLCLKPTYICKGLINVVFLSKRPMEWELIPDYWLNMCESVSKFTPLQITLGCYLLSCKWVESCIILVNSSFSYNPTSAPSAPAWYINSYLYWDIKLVLRP